MWLRLCARAAYEDLSFPLRRDQSKTCVTGPAPPSWNAPGAFWNTPSPRTRPDAQRNARPGGRPDAFWNTLSQDGHVTFWSTRPEDAYSRSGTHRHRTGTCHSGTRVPRTRVPVLERVCPETLARHPRTRRPITAHGRSGTRDGWAFQNTVRYARPGTHPKRSGIHVLERS